MRNLIPFLIVPLSMAIGLAVHRTYHRPAVLDTLKREYQTARRCHRPSREIGRKLVKAKCEQIRKELSV